MKKFKECNGCNKPSIIWKNHEGNKYCQQCWNSIKNKDPESKNLIPKVSAKKQRQDAEYGKLRERYLNEHSRCQVAVNGCMHEATDIHHTRGGDERSVFYLIQSTWLSTCRSCHNWIHMNPDKARTMGWLK